MRTVTNPKRLFKKVDATDSEGDTVELADLDGIEREGDGALIEKRTVEFDDLSDPIDDFDASMAALREAAEEVSPEDDIDVSVDTQLVTTVDGERVIFLADSSRVGWEIIQQFGEDRRAAYLVSEEDAVVRIQLGQ